MIYSGLKAVFPYFMPLGTSQFSLKSFHFSSKTNALAVAGYFDLALH